MASEHAVAEFATGELPIGSGRPPRQQQARAGDDGDADEYELLLEEQARARELQLETPLDVEWTPGKLKPVLRLVGKTVNWRIRARVGVETDAGLMSEEHTQNIGEPGAEILNRYQPTRALAARSVELNLALAIYEYVQETAVKAGHAVQQAEDLAVELEQARRRPGGAPPTVPFDPEGGAPLP